MVRDRESEANLGLRFGLCPSCLVAACAPSLSPAPGRASGAPRMGCGISQRTDTAGRKGAGGTNHSRRGPWRSIPAGSHPQPRPCPRTEPPRSRRPPTRRSVGAGPGDSRLRALPPCNISGSLSSPCGAGGWPGRITTPNIPHKSAFQSQRLIYGSHPRDRGVSSPADPDVGQLWPSHPQALCDGDILTDVPRPYGGTGHTHHSRAGQDFGGPPPLFGFRSPLGVRARTAACPQPGPAAPFASRSEDVITRLSSRSDVGKLN